jgi:hypothetical protein
VFKKIPGFPTESRHADGHARGLKMGHRFVLGPLSSSTRVQVAGTHPAITTWARTGHRPNCFSLLGIATLCRSLSWGAGSIPAAFNNLARKVQARARAQIWTFLRISLGTEFEGWLGGAGFEPAALGL